jgi:DNA-binding CsgD family transcriptional regulator
LSSRLEGAEDAHVSVTDRRLLGREEELDEILRLVEPGARLPLTCVLEGEAGIGKTTLWLAGVRAASAQGYRVLTARPSEAETPLAFAGLTDVLASAADEVLPELPPVQRRALESALLLGESAGQVDDRAVGAAFLGALRVLAAERPTCLAVDDVQWLDAASVAAVRFALARLGDDALVALLAVRGRTPSWIRRAVPEERLHAVAIGGLSVGAIHELVRVRLDSTFARPTLVKLWETSGGNPFFALELAAALRRRGGTLAPGEELPIPSDLDELLRARVDGLRARALAVAQVVAALADPTVDLVEAALGARFERGLGEALDAGILARDGARLRFTHPLLASAVVTGQTPARRRSLHVRLAEVASSGEERAHHLALATAEPDDIVASTLDEASSAALARGAPAAAAELAEHALRLTPPSSPNDVRRRRLAAADVHVRAGDTERATALLEDALAAAAPGAGRAEVVAHLADVQADVRESVALYREALSEAAGDDALLATIHLGLSHRVRFLDGIEAGLEHARLAVGPASRAGDALRCRALATYCLVHFNAGRGVRRAEIDEARALERSLPGWPLDGGPTWVDGHQLWWTAEVDRARTLQHEVLTAARARDDARDEQEALWFLSFIEWRAGDWEQADRYAAGSLDLQAQLGIQWPPGQLPAAVIAAHRGRIDEARARAESALARAEEDGIGVAQSGHSWVLGFIELSLGNLAASLDLLRRSYEIRNTFLLDPGTRLELGDLLEALVAVGELEEAEEILATWDERAAALDRAWALAILARCRGVASAARGDLDAAFASFDRALGEHARTTDPFHRARTLLALGRTQRRAKRRAAARETLEAARAEFERLGAPLWAEQTRDELARIGGRTSSGDELTESERRIAALVAEGRTNREVAAALFLTEHSVETALTRVYRKLGVRSRAELASRRGANT